MGRRKEAAVAEAVPEADKAGEVLSENPIIRKLPPEVVPHVAYVGFFHLIRNPSGKVCDRTPCSYEGPDGKQREKLDIWSELDDEQLGELFGGGIFQVCCYNAGGRWLKWVDVELPGVERPAESGPKASGGEGGPRVVAIGTSSGTVLDLSPFLPPAAIPIHMYCQQMLAMERERYKTQLIWMDEMNARLERSFSKGIDMATAAQTAASEAMQTIRTMEADRQKDGGKDKKSALKLMRRLAKRERKDRGGIEGKVEELRKALEEASKKSKPEERDKILKTIAVIKEIVHDLPAAVQDLKKVLDFQTESTAQQGAEIAHKAYLEEKGRAKAKAEAEREAQQTALAIEGSAERLDPTVQEVQPEPAPVQAPLPTVELVPEAAAPEPAPAELAPAGETP